jgi:hypothetical protein
LSYGKAGVAQGRFSGEVETMRMGKRPIQALAFDAYGTLFDVQSVISVVN